MDELSPHPRIEQVPEITPAQESINRDLSRANKLNDEIQDFLHPTEGSTPGGQELEDARIDFAQRAGVEVDEVIRPLDQIIQISNLVALELAQLKKLG
mgnify:CR=1 FL=1